MVYLPNGIEFVQLLYAVFTLGAIVVPINTRLTPKELAYFAQDSEPKAIAVHSENMEAIRPMKGEFNNVTWIVAGTAVKDAVAFDDLTAPGTEPLPDVSLTCEDCMVQYTSGTTGKPKGAVATAANLIVQHCFLNAIDWGITKDDSYLVTTPLAHRAGFARIVNALALGGTLVIMERFDSEKAIDLIERERITSVGMVPTVARMLLPHLEKNPGRCASLRHLMVTGETFPVGIKRALIELLPNVRLHSFFAMTEVGPVTSLEDEEQFTHPTSVGRPIAGLQVKLVDDAGTEVPVGEAGEMLVRSGVPGRFTAMRGYYNRPDETASTIVDGWVRTGDIARYDADGYLYIVDRKKDMILSGGFNIYSKEVEQALLEHPAIADVAVVGVPDPIFGEAVAAFFELRAGAELNAEMIVEHCRSRIAGYKKPKHIYFVDTLPRNPLGKVLKNELRNIASRKLEEQASI
jgi:long-chain acyl-CoA synthetase